MDLPPRSLILGFHLPSLYHQVWAWTTETFKFFNEVLFLKVSALPCFYFLPYSDCAPQLSTSTFSLAKCLFSTSFPSVLLLHLIKQFHSRLTNHLLSLLLKRECLSSEREWSTCTCWSRYWIFSLSVTLRNPLVYSWF